MRAMRPRVSDDVRETKPTSVERCVGNFFEVRTFLWGWSWSPRWCHQLEDCQANDASSRQIHCDPYLEIWRLRHRINSQISRSDDCNIDIWQVSRILPSSSSTSLFALVFEACLQIENESIWNKNEKRNTLTNFFHILFSSQFKANLVKFWKRSNKTLYFFSNIPNQNQILLPQCPKVSLQFPNNVFLWMMDQFKDYPKLYDSWWISHKFFFGRKMTFFLLNFTKIKIFDNFKYCFMLRQSWKFYPNTNWKIDTFCPKFKFNF